MGAGLLLVRSVGPVVTPADTTPAETATLAVELAPAPAGAGVGPGVVAPIATAPSPRVREVKRDSGSVNEDSDPVPDEDERPTPGLSMRSGEPPAPPEGRRGLPDSPLRDAIRAMRPPPLDPLAEPVPRHPPRPKSELAPAGGGRRKSEKTTFVARVDEDGRVHLKDRPNLRVQLPCLRCVMRASAEDLQEWSKDPYAYTRSLDTEQTMVPGRPMIRSVEHAPGSTERPDAMIYVPLITGGFDLTDWAMRAAGDDPYAAEKSAFLERTREERAGMALVERDERVRIALRDLPRLLDRVWDDRRREAAARRRTIYELWEECDVTRAGREARATILAWIRRRLPPGSPDAFTVEELRRYSAGPPGAFDPY